VGVIGCGDGVGGNEVWGTFKSSYRCTQ